MQKSLVLLLLNTTYCYCGVTITQYSANSWQKTPHPLTCVYCITHITQKQHTAREVDKYHNYRNYDPSTSFKVALKERLRQQMKKCAYVTMLPAFNLDNARCISVIGILLMVSEISQKRHTTRLHHHNFTRMFSLLLYHQKICTIYPHQ